MNAPKSAIQAGNAMMRERILQMPTQPYRDGVPAYRVVAIPGRRSSRLHQVPLAVFQHAGQRYVIAPTRRRDWVENLIAAQQCTLIAHDMTEVCVARLTTDAAAVAAALAYRIHIGTGMSSEQFTFTAAATLAEVQAQMPAMAVFRLTSQPESAPRASGM